MIAYFLKKGKYPQICHSRTCCGNPSALNLFLFWCAWLVCSGQALIFCHSEFSSESPKDRLWRRSFHSPTSLREFSPHQTTRKTKSPHFVGTFLFWCAWLVCSGQALIFCHSEFSSESPKDRLWRRSFHSPTSLREFSPHQTTRKTKSPHFVGTFLFWCAWRDSNSRPSPSEGDTLSS